MSKKGRMFLHQVLPKLKATPTKPRPRTKDIQGKANLRKWRVIVRITNASSVGRRDMYLRTCLKRGEHNEPPRDTCVKALEEEGHCKGAPLCYAWGKVREQDALILFDRGSTHNFISHELALK